MPKQRLEFMGKLGLNTDIEPFLLPPQALTKALNVVTEDGSLRSVSGERKLFDLDIKPLYHTGYIDASGEQYLIVSDGVSVHAYTMEGTKTDLSPTTPWVGGMVTFTNLNGVLVVNSTTDGPWYWGGSGALTALPGWDAGWTCRTMVAFKYYLVALNMTESGTEYPHKVRWSNSAAEGELPTLWVAAESNDAGADLIGETAGVIVGAVLSRDTLMVLKEDAAYSMQWIGGQFIMQLTRLSGSVGTRLDRAFCAMHGQLAVFTTSDLKIFDGQQAQSLLDKRVRGGIFGAVSEELWENSQLAFHEPTSQLLLMVVEAGYDRLSSAFVYNLEEDSWGQRKLTHCYGMDSAYITVSSGQVPWDSWTARTWDELREEIWNKGVYQPSVQDIVLYESNQDDTLWWVSAIAVSATNSDGTFKSCIAERVGIPIEGFVGSAMITEVRPEAENDIPLYLSIGAQDSANETPRWDGPYVLDPMADQIITPRVTGRYLCYRVESFGDGRWKLGALNIKWEPAGQR